MKPETRSGDMVAVAHGLPDPVRPIQPALGHSPPQALGQNANGVDAGGTGKRSASVRAPQWRAGSWPTGSRLGETAPALSQREQMQGERTRRCSLALTALLLLSG
jgi:hypothetical protein